MPFDISTDDYRRRRFDVMAENVAVTRTKVESIEKTIVSAQARHEKQEERLVKLERKVFALWLIAPIVLGISAAMVNARTWFMGR